MRTLMFVVCLFRTSSLAAQTDAFAPNPESRFPTIDVYASGLRIRDSDIEQLTDTLTSAYPTELEKARAIFAWISENIAYDCGSENRLLQEPADAIHPIYFPQMQLKNILSTRRTRCEGYAFLFKLMCNLSGIYCTMLEGYARFDGENVDPATVRPNHAWNAARLDGAWFEIDLTAGAGHCDGPRFRRQRDDAYFRISAQLLERLYIPVNDGRQLFNQGRIWLKR